MSTIFDSVVAAYSHDEKLLQRLEGGRASLTSTKYPTPQGSFQIRNSMASPRETLRQKLKGKSVVVPDLFALFEDWSVNVNINLEAGRIALSSWLSRHVKDEKRLRALQKADFALIGGGFYSGAPLDKYVNCLEYLGWIWIYDDDIDCGSLTHERNESARARKECVEYLNLCLGPNPPATMPEVRDTVSSFLPIAVEFRSNSAPETSQRILKEIVAYVDEAALELNLREGDEILSVEDYIESRHISGAAGPNIAMLEYCHSLNLPSWFFENEAVKQIWRSTSALIFLTNDMISLQKEVETGQVDSIVPIVMHNMKMDVQSAMNEAWGYLRVNNVAFRAAEAHLPLPSGDDQVDADIKTWVQGCKEMVMGNMNWSYETKRYVRKMRVKEGNVIILQF